MSKEMKVHFELLEQPDRVEGIAKLLLRRGRLTPSVLILCPNDGFAAQLNERLWTIHPESFLAHGLAGTDIEKNAAQQDVIFIFHGAKLDGTVLVDADLSEATLQNAEITRLAMLRTRWISRNELTIDTTIWPGVSQLPSNTVRTVRCTPSTTSTRPLDGDVTAPPPPACRS